MYICESATNTSLLFSERNCKHAHIPSTLAFYFLRPKSLLAFCLDSPISCGNIKSRTLYFNRLDFCRVGVGQVKIELAPFVAVRAMLLYMALLTDNSYQGATLPSSTWGFSHACGVTLAQAQAEPVKSWTTYKDTDFQEQTLTELLPTAP